jgi:hypothetical protein
MCIKFCLKNNNYNTIKTNTEMPLEEFLMTSDDIKQSHKSKQPVADLYGINSLFNIVPMYMSL